MSWKQKLRRADAGCQHETWKRVLRGTTSAFVLPLCRTRTWINWPGLSGRPFASLTVFFGFERSSRQTDCQQMWLETVMHGRSVRQISADDENTDGDNHLFQGAPGRDIPDQLRTRRRRRFAVRAGKRPGVRILGAAPTGGKPGARPRALWGLPSMHPPSAEPR